MWYVHCMQSMSDGARHMSHSLRCGTEATCSVCDIKLFYFGDLYVWRHGSYYELAYRCWQLHRVGEAYFECASVSGVYDAYAISQHGVVFDDAASCNDFSVVSLWRFDADASVVHDAPWHLFDLFYDD